MIMDPEAVVAAVLAVSPEGRKARIVRLTDILHDADLEIGGEEALDWYGVILRATRDVEIPGFRSIVHQEAAKVAHRIGREETAASHALEAAKVALHDGDSGLAAGLMKQSARIGILGRFPTELTDVLDMERSSIPADQRFR